PTICPTTSPRRATPSKHKASKHSATATLLVYVYQTSWSLTDCSRANHKQSQSARHHEYKHQDTRPKHDVIQTFLKKPPFRCPSAGRLTADRTFAGKMTRTSTRPVERDIY